MKGHLDRRTNTCQEFEKVFLLGNIPTNLADTNRAMCNNKQRPRLDATVISLPFSLSENMSIAIDRQLAILEVALSYQNRTFQTLSCAN